MALTATGFPGSVSSVQFASMAGGFGSLGEVDGQNDYRCTVAAGDRTVRVDTGVAHAGGVRVVNDAAINVQLDAIGSGSRWDLIRLTRNWSGSGSVSVTKLTGTSVKAIPGAANDTLGAIHDQWIALARVTAGQTAVQELIDLRLSAHKVYTARDLLAVPKRLGIEAVVNDVRYRCVAGNGGVLDFVETETASRAFHRTVSLTPYPLISGTITEVATDLGGSLANTTVPAGASRAFIRADITGLEQGTGDLNAVFRVQAGTGGQGVTVVGRETRIRAGDRNGMAQGEFTVSGGQTLTVECNLRNLAGGARPVISSATVISYTVTFS